MEALDLEAPGRTQASFSDRLRALWASLAGDKSRSFKRLAQDDVPDMEETFREAGVVRLCSSRTYQAASVFFQIQQSCIPIHSKSRDRSTDKADILASILPSIPFLTPAMSQGRLLGYAGVQKRMQDSGPPSLTASAQVHIKPGILMISSCTYLKSS